MAQAAIGEIAQKVAERASVRSQTILAVVAPVGPSHEATGQTSLAQADHGNPKGHMGVVGLKPGHEATVEISLAQADLGRPHDHVGIVRLEPQMHRPRKARLPQAPNGFVHHALPVS